MQVLPAQIEKGISPGYFASAHLYVPAELYKNSSLAGEEELAELELRHHARLNHSVPGLAPSGRQ